jgi:hypothetical protein
MESDDSMTKQDKQYDKARQAIRQSKTSNATRQDKQYDKARQAMRQSKTTHKARVRCHLC